MAYYITKKENGEIISKEPKGKGRTKKDFYPESDGNWVKTISDKTGFPIRPKTEAEIKAEQVEQEKEPEHLFNVEECSAKIKKVKNPHPVTYEEFKSYLQLPMNVKELEDGSVIFKNFITGSVTQIRELGIRNLPPNAVVPKLILDRKNGVAQVWTMTNRTEVPDLVIENIVEPTEEDNA